MLLKHWKAAAFLAISAASQIDARFERLAEKSNDGTAHNAPNKDQFVDSLVSKMSVSDLGKFYAHTEKKAWITQMANRYCVVLQLHLMFADDIVGKDSHNELYGSHKEGLCVRRQLTPDRSNDAPQPKIPNWRNA